MIDEVPIAEEWLNDEQLAEVRRQVGDVGPLVTIDDIFMRCDIWNGPRSRYLPHLK